MRATLSKAVLTISIDLDGEADRTNLAALRSREAIADRLLEILARHDIPATWAVAEPAGSPAVERIVARRAGHEIALLGDGSWVGSDLGRSGYGRELARRMSAAEGAGHSISTLVMPGDTLDEHGDLAIKHGIAAVRHAARAGADSARTQPGTLRFGLWSFPVTCTLPGHSRWMPGGGGGRTARLVMDRAIVQDRLVTLAIDAPQLAARGYAAQRVLDAVLAHAERRRRQGVLEIATIGATAARLSSRQQSVPSRSILRPAA